MIAKLEGVSENTVSLVATKFRKKLRESAAVRQGCFEPFYVHGDISEEFYRWIINVPADDPEFYRRAGHCALNCISEFGNKSAAWSSYLRASKAQVLNLNQTQRFFDSMFADGRTMRLRIACTNCPVGSEGPTRKTQFYQFMGYYLRDRNLTAKHVQEHFLLCAINCLLHYRSVVQLGIIWSKEEIRFPDESTWENLKAQFAEQMAKDSFSLLQYFVQFLEDDPLTR